MILHDLQLPKPKSWETFEQLARALFAEIWNDPLAKPNGRRGQPQHGVDVYGEPEGAGGPVHGVQCKGKDDGYDAKASIAEFDAELAKAEKFEPGLAHWVFATTAPDDAALQKHVRQLSKARKAEGLFTVDVLGWGSIQALIARHLPVIRQFYPDFVPRAFDDLKLLASTSAEALDGIDHVLIQGDASLELVRPELWLEARKLLERTGLVRLSGEGGSGKSGLLRRLGKTFDGPVVVITDNRTTAQSFQQHLASLGIQANGAELFAAVAAERSAMLLIDGADRMLLSNRRGVLVDALKLIAESSDPSRWRLVTTARNYQDRDLVADAMAAAGIQDVGVAVEVGLPNGKDAGAVADAFPSIAPLLKRQDLSGRNRSLFTIRELLARQLPTGSALTETIMAAAWAEADMGDPERSARRSRALSELAQRLVDNPWSKPTRAEIDPVGLQLLIDEGAVRLVPNQDAIGLSHDVHEDWLLARALSRKRDDLAGVLKQAGEPLWWQRAVRLVAQVLLEAGEYEGWSRLLDTLHSNRELDPAWARATLVAPLYSEQADEILPKIEPMLLADDAQLLARLTETLLVFETRLDSALLNSPHLAQLDEKSRYSVAAHYKVPHLESWATFLRFSLSRWDQWPRTLIPRLADVASLFTRALRNIDNWMSKSIAELALRWLREIEDAEAEPWDNRREPFDTKLEQYRGWEETQKTLRNALVQAAISAPDTVKTYVEQLTVLPDRDGARTHLLEAHGSLPTLFPTAWTEMCLRHFVPPRKRVRHDSDFIFRRELFSFMDMHDAGIDRDQGFFPSSPLHGGFADLFKSDETEALRLLHRLEMRASVTFRWSMKCNEGRQAIPLTLRTPWGAFRLWGDEAVYRWSRATLGSPVLGSAYLALDDWLHEQPSGGRPVEELLKLVLQNHGLVATAAPCIALITDHLNDGDTIDLAGPFLSEPRLWNYDIRRHIDDQTPTHRIGHWSPSPNLEATERIFERCKARQPLHHALLLPFRLKAGAEAQRAFDARRAEWSGADLAAFEEEMNNPELCAERDAQVVRYRSDSDPKQIEVERINESQLAVSIAPPEDALGQIEELTRNNRLLESASRLANWVNRCRDTRTVSDGFTIEEAISFATHLAEEFEANASRDIDFARRIGAAGVVGAAGVAAVLGDTETIERHRDWIEQWLVAGATMQRSPMDNELTINEAILTNDAQALGSWGLAALASRGFAHANADATVIGAAVQRLHGVTEAVIQGLAWTERPEFARAVHVAALDSCIIDIGYWWREGDERRKAAERTTKLRAQAARRAITAWEKTPQLPPRPFSKKWVRPSGKFQLPRRLTMPAKRVFDWGKGAAILKAVDWARLVDTAERQADYARYLAGLVEWTRAYAEEDDRRDARYPYEWGHTLGREVGRFAASTGRDQEWRSLTGFGYRDRAEDLVGNYLDGAAHAMIATGEPPDDPFWTAWRSAAQWTIDRTVPPERGRYDHLSQSLFAAGLVGPYFTPIPPDWPYLEDVLPWIDSWVERTAHLPRPASSALAIVERMTAAQRSRWFIEWLTKWTAAAGPDESYWSYNGLGNSAAALLRGLTVDDPEKRRTLRVCLGIMADAGSIVARELLPSFSVARPVS
ncbi:MAG TPA: hypothetical protein VFW35_03170 [Sphingomicrobium sp.]|nr:hypothetical protein [Sphingomicrobium sp.]